MAPSAGNVHFSLGPLLPWGWGLPGTPWWGGDEGFVTAGL